ncbi:hypothetical protein [Xanthomonas arboricola]|uniref:Transmembrane protein n=1 Tax=Xanthomonas arboricola pv. guizotiae TaxID=487867 RepID=A0A2S6ZX38_9XANT|nr:hypothetical protein [Xanthomonas arboricola]PPT97467.1 hypothetical protein XarbCFBP7409_14190 [Xanthomonas arboricola pv. guizotiae]PPU27021.1 hypothetical protein XarbCFBP7408_02245 [Xanthomonas arboricola pv. guizotiae]
MDASPLATTPSASAEDLQQLKLLSIFHYVLAGITGLFSLFPLLHLFLGIAMVSGHMPAQTGSGAPQMDERLFGWFFVAFAAVFIVCGLTLAACMAYAGRCIAQRRRHLLCLIVAGISCSFMPFGTVVGVFTLVVLLRPQVKALFAPTATAA